MGAAPDEAVTEEALPEAECFVEPSTDTSAHDEAAGPGRASWAARLVRRGPWGALAEQWVPESLRHARVSPGRRGAVLVALVAVAAAAVAAVSIWWRRPEPTPLPAAPSAALSALTSQARPSAAGSAALGTSAAGPGAAGLKSAGAGSAGLKSAGSGTAGPAAPGRSDPGGTDADSVGADGTGADASGDGRPDASGPILVSVTGRVHHPGLVTVAPDARVADAIAAAGGALHAEDLTGLNLAAHLHDGDSVVVVGADRNTVVAESATGPGSGGGGSGRGASGAKSGGGTNGGGASDSGSPIDLNSADATALEQLPAVGPVTAASIISWREQHGPFTSIEQLQAVSGIGPATFAQLAPHVTV